MMGDNDGATPKPKVCDLVMQGGVTSGVVYPGAVCELAQQYRFHCIGGSSAGAIAAALTAAAEYRRQKAGGDDKSGFELLSRLPNDLGETNEGRSVLISLFQPQPALSRLFNTLIALAGGGKDAPLRLFLAGMRNYALPWLAIALVFTITAVTPPSDHVFGLVMQVLGLTLLLLLFPLGVLAGVMRFDLAKLPRKGYAFCTGATEGDKATPGLCDWLHAKLQATAGKAADEPLIFEDLWRCPHPYGGDSDRDHPGINLRVTTTSLTWQQLLCLPSDGGDYGRLYFRPDEFARMFPQPIVDQMVRASNEELERRLDLDRRSNAPSLDDQARTKGYHRMPDVGALPVLVAVRMSLSFPVLLAPIKLYERDFSRVVEKQADPEEERRLRTDKQQEMRAVYFSDGGICSNMPVHFFDAPVPTHPTFALHLASPHPDAKLRPDLRKPVWVSKSASGGMQPGRYAMQEEDRPHSLLHFAASVLNSARHWSDHNQMRLDGYRDRIAHIALEANEGGLNLNMPAELITKLSNLGKSAAQLLDERFASITKDSMTVLEDHRWRRIRNSQYALAESLAQVRQAFDQVPHPLAGISKSKLDKAQAAHCAFAAAVDALIADPAFAALRDLEETERDDHARAAQYLSYRPQLRLRARL